MITGTEIYWITRMSYFQGATMTIGIISVIGTTMWLACSLVAYFDENKTKTLKAALPTFILSLAILTGSLFIPSTKEMCAIKVLPAIINNENVQEMPNKIVDLANEWLEELKPKKGELK